MPRALLLASALTLTLAGGGCAAPLEAEETASDTAELRVTPEDIVGEIRYGDRLTIAYTGTPRYRAWWFNGTKGDWINLTVASSTGSIRAWVTDEAFNEQHRGAISALRKTGKFYVVVREGNLADATLTVDLKKRIPSTTPPAPAPVPAPTPAE